MTDPVPSLVQRDLLQGLIEQWRAKAQEYRDAYGFGDPFGEPMAESLDDCADELEAVAARLVVGEARQEPPAVTQEQE